MAITKNGRVIILSKCGMCINKKSTFIKQKEARRLFSSLGIKILLNKIPLLDLFRFISINNARYKMKEIVNKFFWAGCKFMHIMHLRSPRFTYASCGPFTQNKERIQKFEETGNSRYIYKNELDKDCFQHDMTYGDFKYLARKAVSDKIFCNKTFNIAKNPKYVECQSGLASMAYNFFDKELLVGVLKWKFSNQNLAEELHKAIIKTIWGAGALILLIFN